MTTRKQQATTFVGALAFVVSLQSQAAEPLQLSDSQLDKVTAGFLATTVAADALALSQVADAFTDTLTSTNVVVGQPQEDGFIYSSGDGLAIATAIGEQVWTSTSGGFETDEQIVSFQVNHGATTETVEQAAPALANIQKQTDQKAQQRAQEAVALLDKQATRAAERLAAQEQRADDRAAANDLKNQQLTNPDKRAARQAAKAEAKTDVQAARAAEIKARQEQRAENRDTRQAQNAAKQQAKQEARARARAARQTGGDPVLQQTQVLQLQIVTRRPATDLPL